MRKLILGLFLLLIPSLSFGANVLIFQEGKDYVRLFDKQCHLTEILVKLPPEYKDQMRLGEAQITGKKYSMCWVLLPDMSVGIMYPDGEQGRLPAQEFKPESDI